MILFRKILIFGMFATAAGYAFADGNPEPVCINCGLDDNLPMAQDVQIMNVSQQLPSARDISIPVWPMVGSDADVQITGRAVDNVRKNDDNIRIVSKIGSDLVVENNINLGVRGDGSSFSGGADMLHPYQAPAGFNIYEAHADMPLFHQEMVEDDGAPVLVMSRSDRKKKTNVWQGGSMAITQTMLNDYKTDHPDKNLPNKIADLSEAQRRAVFASVAGINVGDMTITQAMLDDYKVENPGEFLPANVSELSEYQRRAVFANATGVNVDDIILAEVEIADDDVDAEVSKGIQDQVRSWVVASGQTLRDVLQDWCNKEGWDLIWGTAREYPIEASAVFKGRFVDVSSALVRNFARATPVPYAKFYKGNRVMVVTTTEEGN